MLAIQTTPRATTADKKALNAAEQFFAGRGWTPFAFQRETWAAQAAGKSGLINAPTGFGKTYAAFCGLCGAGSLPPGGRAGGEGLAAHTQIGDTAPPSPQPSPRGRGSLAAPPIAVLWITPLKALAADTLLSLKDAAATMQPTWTVGLRTGDVSTSERAKQDRRLPTVLVTTPESLALMLTKADWQARLGSLNCIVVDEWHELLSSKRGVLLELCLSRVRGGRKRGSKRLQTWGMSATLGNLDEAMRVLIGPDAALAGEGVLISGKIKKDIVIDSLKIGRAHV